MKLRSIRAWWRWGGLACAIGIGCWLAAKLLLLCVPLPPGLFRPPLTSVTFTDRYGRTLREVSSEDYAIGSPIAFADVPEALMRATVAAEDQRFWHHSGVDWRATGRAFTSLVRHGRIISGGSTITQQLIKLAAPRPRTFRAKLIEALQARRLEQVWSKERILTEYFQRLDYGNCRIGAGAAATYYFGKPLRDLSVAEAALLAGLPQAPTRLNPHLHPERARKRQAWILGRMRVNGFLQPEEYARAMSEPVKLQRPRRVFQAPHLVDLILRQHPELMGQAKVPLVRTTVDLELNQFVERILAEQLARLRAHHVHDGSVVIIDNRNGNLLALVGSEDYFAPVSGQVNGAWASRSAGSTFKPFTYALAFEHYASPATVVADVPTEFATPTGVFAPVNYNHRYYGPMRYRLALANSLNVAAVRVLAQAGGPAALKGRLLACGLRTLDKPADYYGLGLTIGNAETRLLELANAYACLARLGAFKPFRLLLSPAESGLARPSVVEGAGDLPRQVCQREAAYWVADILSDNTARMLAFGADSSLRFDFPVACKTGTSSDFRDNWALGYTPEYTVGVWIGNFDNTPMEQVSGVTGAAPILHEVFVHLHQRFGTSWYATPPNLVTKAIHPITGKLLDRFRPEGQTEKFFAPVFPEPERPEDYDEQGRVRLPAEYRDWLLSSDNWLGSSAVLADSSSPTLLRILIPLPGTIYYLDSDLPNHGSLLRLRAAGSRAVQWQCKSLTLSQHEGETYAMLTEGIHEFVARDPIAGQQTNTWIEVKRR